MTTTSIADFNALRQSQIEQHEQLAEQLVQIQHLIDFTASSDLKNPNPLQLNAQLIAIEKLLREVQALNEHLQSALVCYSLPTEDPQ